jgi:hypothetical protein
VVVSRTIEIGLSIPDNEARTALATLQRLGVDVAALERGDVWRFGVRPAEEERLVATLRGIETVFNPNKHRLVVRGTSEPGPGEVWIDEPDAGSALLVPPFRIAGRTLEGVVTVERFLGWRLRDRHGSPAEAEIVDRAVETLLCNPAFQRARR